MNHKWKKEEKEGRNGVLYNQISNAVLAVCKKCGLAGWCDTSVVKQILISRKNIQSMQPLQLGYVDVNDDLNKCSLDENNNLIFEGKVYCKLTDQEWDIKNIIE